LNVCAVRGLLMFYSWAEAASRVRVRSGRHPLVPLAMFMVARALH
jgi:hypothetical protein